VDGAAAGELVTAIVIRVDAGAAPKKKNKAAPMSSAAKRRRIAETRPLIEN
jgi:hypothetical protein